MWQPFEFQTIVFVAMSVLVCFTVCEQTEQAQQPPNFIILLMDDQDIMLDSPSFMPNVQSKMVRQGMSFTNALVATPVCCPSRTELMTGRYFHNVGAPGK